MRTYIISNEVNTKLYVGQTKLKNVKSRLTKHLCAARNGSKYTIHNAMRKYGFDKFSIYELSIHESEIEMNLMEIALIHVLKSDTPDFGYNMTKGGEGGKGRAPGWHHSEETKAKMSISALGNKNGVGRIVSQEIRDRMRTLTSTRMMGNKYRLSDTCKRNHPRTKENITLQYRKNRGQIERRCKLCRRIREKKA